MKTTIFIVFIAFAVSESKYYQLVKFGMSQLVHDTDGFKCFVDCLLDRAPCSKLYNTYKVLCAEAVEQKCKKCSPYQKNAFWLFLQALIAKFPRDYYNFRQKYDPENKYFQDLEIELSKYSSAY